MPPGEDTSVLGKGYDTKYDEATGKALARFPPKWPNRPDMGFLWGLKSCCEALKGIWQKEMGQQGVWEDLEEMVELKKVFERAFPEGEEDVLST
jgi:hypothetical protein